MRRFSPFHCYPVRVTLAPLPEDDADALTELMRLDVASEFASHEVPVLPHSFVPSLKTPLPALRCRGVNPTSGRRCNHRAAPGATVCLSCGGDSVHVQEAAQRAVNAARMKLAMATHSAVDRVIALIDDENAPSAVQLKAAESVMDRVGLRGGVEISGTVEHTVDESVHDIITARLDRLRKSLVPPDDDVVDAEVVPSELPVSAPSGASEGHGQSPPGPTDTGGD